MSPRHLVGVALAVVAAALLLAGSLSHRWYQRVGKHETTAFGLTGVQECYRGECKSAEWSAFRDPKFVDYVEPLSRVALAGTVLVIAMIGAAASVTVKRRGAAVVLGILAAAASAAAAIGAIGTIVFLRHIAEHKGPHAWETGWSVMAYVAGAVVGLASGILVAGGKRRGA